MGRINVYERWESDVHLDAFRGTGSAAEQTEQILDADVCAGTACRPPSPPELHHVVARLLWNQSDEIRWNPASQPYAIGCAMKLDS